MSEKKFEVNGKTQLIPLLGYPVRHSMSPQMHNAAFRILGLNYAYLAFEVKPEDFNTAIEGLKILGVRGLNLTMPFKHAILPYLDDLSPAARLANAANIITFENGRMYGHTTDGAGYMRSLREDGFDIIGKKMTLIGFGGAGTSIAVQAALDGVEAIDVFNRMNKNWHDNVEFGEKLASETGCRIRIFNITDEEQLKRSIQSSAVLTNATSLGMEPNPDTSPIPDSSFLHPELVVSDIIYNPMVTKLMKMGQEVGCPTQNGLPMLLYQGAVAFNLWTGREMPVDQVKEALGL